MKKNRKKISVLCIIMLFQMVACSATELEERCFPSVTVVGMENQKVAYALSFPRESEIKVPIAKDTDFKASKEKYESRLNKQTDYNHLKVIVFEEAFMEQMPLYEEMLDYLAETEEYPRNTYVCAVDDVEDLLEIEEGLPQELGSYLEEYLNMHESRNDDMITLGDLIDEKENKKMVLYLPYLEVEDAYVQWKGYYAVGMGMPPVKFE